MAGLTTASAYAPKHRRRAGGLAAALGHNVDLLFSSGSLLGSTAVTSALGFVYWIVAARMFDAQVVGVASAAVSALTLLGSLGMFGLGTLLITELGRSPHRAPELVSAGLAAAGAAATVLALVYVCVAPLLSPRLFAGPGAWGLATILVGGVTATAVGLVFDQVLVGLRLSHVQMWRNTYFAAGKLLLIALLGAGIGAAGPAAITATWVAGTLGSFALVAPHLRRRGVRLLTRPRPSALRGLARAALGHNALNLATTIPRVGLPLVVASALSPTANATFFIAWMIVGFLYMLPTHLSTSLFAIAAGDSAALRTKLRFALAVSAVLGVPGSLLLMVLAGPVMGIFGTAYLTAGPQCLALLTLSYAPTVVKQLYMAVARVTGTLRRAAIVAAAGAAAELAAAWLGGRLDGILGVATWFSLACAIETAVMIPPLVAAARRRTTPNVVMPADPPRRFVGICQVQTVGFAAVVAVDTHGTVPLSTLDADHTHEPRTRFSWFSATEPASIEDQLRQMTESTSMTCGNGDDAAGAPAQLPPTAKLNRM
ncbi:lipopolysaccharide biosynthesis protein [Dactylosporangium sp. CA-092794]|uniref:lipopolysaccharide biosynthesis protein n=1 Tax=Dactylosporangium sp. CA-092794 TaxID=3239929 RepID=UPI003D8EBC66